MVTHSGTATRIDDVRALNTPKHITVVVEGQQPIRVITQRTEVAVVEVRDTWIVQDEWWRTEIDRQYFALLMAGGEFRTVFHDRMEDVWYEQAY